MGKLIKDKKRITELGEVFTPQKVVLKMISMEGISEQINSLTSTFLEPAAGEGAFLVEILARKMNFALETSSTEFDFNDNSLIVLSSLYGIELMEDNVEMLVMNMFAQFNKDYRRGIKMLNGKVSDAVLNSAKVIIQANMVQGDTLTGKNSQNYPIIISEWKLLEKKNGRQRVQRIECKFSDIVNGKKSTGDILKNIEENEQLDLFTIMGDDYEKITNEVSEVKYYVPVQITNVYKKKVKYKGD